MSDVTVDRLVVLIEAQTRSFETQIKKLEGQVNQSSSKMSSGFSAVNREIMGAGEAIAKFYINAGLIASIPAEIIHIVRSLGEIPEQAAKAGTSIANIQKLTFAGLKTGTGVDTIVAGLQTLNKELGEASTKATPLRELLKANKIPLFDAKGNLRDAASVLLDIADLMKRFNTEGEKAAALQMAIPKGWKELLPFLKQGGDAIREQMGQAVVASDALVEKFNSIGTKLAQLGVNWERGIGAQLLSSVDELERIAGLFDKLQQKAGAAAGQDPLGWLANVLGASKIHDWFAGIFGGKAAAPSAPGGPDSDVPNRSGKAGRLITGLPGVLPTAADASITNAIRSLKEEDVLLQKRNALFAQRNILGDKYQGALAKTEAEERIVAELMGKDANLTRERAEAQVKGNSELQKYLDLLQSATDQSEKLRKTQESVAESSQALADSMQSLTTGALDDINSIGDTALQTLKNLESQLINAFLYGSGPFAGLLGTKGQNGNPGGVIGSFITGMVGQAAPSFAPAGGAAAAAAAVEKILAVEPLPEDVSIVSKALPALAHANGSVAVGAPGATAQWGPFTGDIQAAAAKYNLDPNTLAALIQHESSFNPLAKNPVSSATGLTQLLSGTARDVGVTNRLDPTQSIFGGAKYLSQQYAQFGDTRTALAAYYQGPGSVANYGVNAAGGQYASQIMAQSAKYAQAVTTTAQAAQQGAGTFQASFAPALGGILQSIQSALGGSGGGLGSLLSAFGIGGAGGGSGLSGARASGGPVGAGMAYLVGERGREVFVPNMSGYILPNGAYGGVGGGTPRVSIKNYGSAQFEQRQGRGADGLPELELLVDKHLKDKFPRMLKGSLRDTYGISPRRTQRT